MQCPECTSTHIRKNGKKQGKQNHICVACSRQFVDRYESPKGYSDDVKRECLKLYVNGMGFRAIERVKGVHHTTVITWVKQVGELLPDAYAPEVIPTVGELDELETFVGSKKTRSGLAIKGRNYSLLFCLLWTAVDHFRVGILGACVRRSQCCYLPPLVGNG